MTREQVWLRIGAGSLIVGSVAAFVFPAAHGDLPTGTAEAALSFVASPTGGRTDRSNTKEHHDGTHGYWQ